MTTLEPEQKDILEKLNEISLEVNWGTVERVHTNESSNGVPKAVAVIQEAVEEIKRLRELPKEIFQCLFNFYNGNNEEGFCDFEIQQDLKVFAEKYGVNFDEKNS